MPVVVGKTATGIGPGGNQPSPQGDSMKRTATMVIAFLMTVIGFTGTASASVPQDNYAERIVNSSALTITGGFLFDATDEYVSLNISSGSNQGETNGNYAYEPRNLHVKSQWCMNYHYHYLSTNTVGSTTTLCAPSNVYPIGSVAIFYVYKGDTWCCQNYDIVVTRYWGP